MSLRRIVASSFAFAGLGLATLMLTACPPPPRICTNCTYKRATFTAVPPAPVTSATMTATVTHVGACPQSAGPPNCTETLTWDVKCKLPTGSAPQTVVLDMMINALPNNVSQQATLVVQPTSGPPVTIVGTVSPTNGGSKTRPADPCPPPPVPTVPNLVP